MQPEAHRTASCRMCHQGGVAASAARGTALNGTCLGCHEGTAPVQTGTTNIHGPDRQDCLTCHHFHQTDLVNTTQGQLAPGSPGPSSGHCRSCHSPEGRLSQVSEAHRMAATLYHSAGAELRRTSPSQACLRCHDSTSASPWQRQTAGTLTLNTHASHPFGVKVVAGQGNSVDHIRWDPDSRLPLFDGRMECQSCHLLSSGTDDDLIAYTNPYDLCLGCHEHDPGSGWGTTDMVATMVRR